MSRLALVLTTAILSLAFAPVPFPKPDPAKDDLKNLQGEWVRVRYTQGEYTEIGDKGSMIAITGDRLKYTQGEMYIGDYSLALDGKKKMKALDFACTAGLSKGTLYWGLYRLEGDTFTLCYRQGAAAAERPTEFDPDKQGVVISVYKRKKK
jgi:uncharacterized protein (TIGR03067 family)